MIIDYYDIKEDRVNWKQGIKALADDIKAMAEEQFRNNEYQKFQIKFKLVPINPYM